MTARPLERDFLLVSPIVGDHATPDYVTAEDCLLEMDAEMDRRRAAYPKFVEKNQMTPEQMRWHIDVWAAMIDDHVRTLPLGARRAAEPYRYTWEIRIRELRRELAMRRAAYPKWIANPAHPLDLDVARAKLVALDHVHYRYWYGWCLLPPVPFTHPREAGDVLALDAPQYLAHPIIEARRAKARKLIAWQSGESDQAPDLTFPGQLRPDEHGRYGAAPAFELTAEAAA